jgi:hypothetical protein
MYVYKQTLFDINYDFNKKKDNDYDSNNKLIQSNSYINLLNICIEYTIENDIRSYKNDFINKLEILSNKIILIPLGTLIPFINLLEILSCKKIELNKFFDIMNIMVKKNNLLLLKCDKKLQDSNFDTYLMKPANVFVNWILDN